VALVLAFLLVGCADTPHKEFLASLMQDSSSNREGNSQIVTALKYSESGQTLLVGRESGEVEIWDATKPSSKRSVLAHTYRVSGFTVTDDGKSFFTSSYFEDAIKLWDRRTGVLLQTISGVSGPIVVSPIARYYIAAHRSELRIFDIKGRTLLPARIPCECGGVTSIAVDAKSSLVAVGSASGALQIWKFVLLDNRPYLVLAYAKVPYAMGNWVQHVFFAQGGSRLYSVSRRGLVNEWMTPNLEKVREITSSLAHVSYAANDTGSGLLAMGGTAGPSGLGSGQVELLPLSNGRSWTYQLFNNFPVVEFLAPIPALIVAQHPQIFSLALPERNRTIEE
jgi:WD40 repeat protein